MKKRKTKFVYCSPSLSSIIPMVRCSKTLGIGNTIFPEEAWCVAEVYEDTLNDDLYDVTKKLRDVANINVFYHDFTINPKNVKRLTSVEYKLYLIKRIGLHAWFKKFFGMDKRPAMGSLIGYICKIEEKDPIDFINGIKIG